jgi:hypothetical protein
VAVLLRLAAISLDDIADAQSRMEPIEPIRRVTDFDRAIGPRLRERRILLDSRNSSSPNEASRNRIATARPHDIITALWPIADPLQGLDTPPQATASERRRLVAGEGLAKLSDRRADAVLQLLRALARPEGEDE